MNNSTEEQSFVGTDISKSRLDVHVRPAGTIFSVARDPDGLATLVKHLLSLTPKLIVLEATGGFEITSPRQLQALVCRLPWSTHARYVTSLAPVVSSRRLIH